jgi:hypothetical protein
MPAVNVFAWRHSYEVGGFINALPSAIRLTCRSHHVVANHLQKVGDALSFIEYDESHSARDANTQPTSLKDDHNGFEFISIRLRR